jgi:hypothetical protein
MDINNPYPRWANVDDDANIEINGGFTRFKTMVTPMDVVKFGLVGVPKVFPMTGEPITEEYIAHHLEAAVAKLEMQGLMLSPVIFSHVDDFTDSGLAGTRFFPVILKKFPLRTVESVKLLFPNATRANPQMEYTIPDTWLSWEQNKLNIIATTGILAPSQIGNNTGVPLYSMMFNGYRPNAFRVTYKAGFDQDKLPALLWKLLVDMTVYDVLNDIGPLLFPSTGINVQQDSVSQSAQLPGPRIFELRMSVLDKEIQRNKQLIMGYYGMQFAMEFAGI